MGVPDYALFPHLTVGEHRLRPARTRVPKTVVGRAVAELLD